MRDSCDCYAKGADWLHAAHRERDFVPELDTALRVIEDTLHVFVGAASGGALSDEDHETLLVLCDFHLWWSLTNRGLPPGEFTQRIVRLVRTQAARGAG